MGGGYPSNAKKHLPFLKPNCTLNLGWWICEIVSTILERGVCTKFWNQLFSSLFYLLLKSIKLGHFKIWLDCVHSSVEWIRIWIPDDMVFCLSPRKSINKFSFVHEGLQSSHLWEFVRDLLLSPEENCGILEWEDRDKGIFRVVKSDALAKMWGQRKKNDRMTYEKLSRALR